MMKQLLTLSFLAVIITMGLQGEGLAKSLHHHKEAKAKPYHLQSVMEVLTPINTQKTNKVSNQNFQQFFDRKEQMNDGIQMLEKATSVREGLATNRAPKSIIPKAY